MADFLRLGCNGFSLSESFDLKRGKLLLALSKGGAFGDALLAFGLGGCALLLDCHDAAFEIGVQTIDALEGGFGASTPLFKPREFSRKTSGILLERLAVLPHCGELTLLFFQTGFGGNVFRLEANRLFALL